MNPEIPVVDVSGKPTPVFRAQWGKLTVAALPDVVIFDGGKPTPAFRSLWLKAFGSSPVKGLPDQVLVENFRFNPLGLARWRAVT